MKNRSKLFKVTLTLFGVLVVGVLLFIIGTLSGGDALDGFAGSVQTNTPLQDMLFSVGTILVAVGLVLFLLSGFLLICRLAYRIFKNKCSKVAKYVH